MMIPCFLLLLFYESNSVKFPKWTYIVVFPTEADERECLINDFNQKELCAEKTELYGGPELCNDVFDSLDKISCIRDSNTDINDLLSKVDKSIEILRIIVNLEKNITVDFNGKYSNEPEEEKYLSIFRSIINPRYNKKRKTKEEGLKIITSVVGNCKEKVSSLYLFVYSNLKIVDSDLNADKVDIGYWEDLDLSSIYGIKTKHFIANVLDINLDDPLENKKKFNQFLHKIEAEKVSFYDSILFITDELLKKKWSPNDISIEFKNNSWIFQSRYRGKISLPNEISKALGLIFAVNNITLIANENSDIPDSIDISLKFFVPENYPIDCIDPCIGGDCDEEEALLLENFKVTILKKGNWDGLKKPKIKIITFNNAIEVDTDGIKDIADVEFVKEEMAGSNDGNNKKGLETKYIIIIVVCCVVVVAIVIIIIVVVIKRSKRVQNKSAASP
ncbi:hypothetical protein M9Y10_043003 [Tritrichomonas musculus]|uniref:Uncharacterized protein n=1 Tax=Tritrichomonas musculus TaxID=1915356 RepID=A0ABR2JYH1_9EUKA